EIIISRRSEEVHLLDKAFTADEEHFFRERVDQRHAHLFGNTLRGSIHLYDRETNEEVWEERISFYLEEDGSFEIPMGLGRLAYADPAYFGLDKGEHTAEVIKPLDYTNPMLVFSVLGFFGLIFAFLLKREDKTSGYGLELPNKND
ncbi:MAG: hypothetical protein ACQESL_06840, partial [Bacteroidota bacterium]